MELRFPDEAGLSDLATLVGRAKSADDAGAIRLQATGTTLAAYVGLLPGGGLMRDGAVIGLRAMPLAERADLDVTVPLSALTDRFARARGTVLQVPPMTVTAPWAAVAPPRGGWESVGTIAAEELYAVAREGIAQVASSAPTDAGAPVLTALRRQVWGRATSTTPPVPAGGAFAAYVLGFLRPGTRVEVWSHGRWTRLSTPAGHVLIR